MAVDANLMAVADILLGAAYADGTGDGSEILAVRDLLKEITGEPKLAEELEKRISTFSVKSFDLEKSANAFKDGAKITPRRASAWRLPACSPMIRTPSWICSTPYWSAAPRMAR